MIYRGEVYKLALGGDLMPVVVHTWRNVDTYIYQNTNKDLDIYCCSILLGAAAARYSLSLRALALISLSLSFQIRIFIS